MPPLIVIVASLNLSVSGTINIVAQPSISLDECRSVGEMAIKAATVEPGSYASYVCHDTTRQQALVRDKIDLPLTTAANVAKLYRKSLISLIGAP